MIRTQRHTTTHTHTHQLNVLTASRSRGGIWTNAALWGVCSQFLLLSQQTLAPPACIWCFLLQTRCSLPICLLASITSDPLQHSVDKTWFMLRGIRFTKAFPFLGLQVKALNRWIHYRIQPNYSEQHGKKEPFKVRIMSAFTADVVTWLRLCCWEQNFVFSWGIDVKSAFVFL